MTKKYSEKFKARMVQRMSPPDAESGAVIFRETGVAMSTLSRWRKNAARVTVRPETNIEESLSTESTTSRRPEDWSPEEKLLILTKAMSLGDDELGKFLRKEGLHEAHLERWRGTILDALKAPSRRSANAKERKEIKRLERELKRKDAALAETAALLVLRGKAQALWGDEGENT